MINSLMLITNIIAFVPIIVSFSIMPYIVRKNVLFGITAPTDFYSSDIARKMRKNYTIKVVVYGLVFSLISFFSSYYLSEKMQSMAIVILIFTLLFIVALIYYSMYKKAKDLKVKLKWDEQTEAAVVTDTSFFTKKITISPLWFIAYAVIIAITIAIGIVLYDKTPNEIPIRIDINKAITYTQKSYRVLLNMPIMQIVISAIFVLVYYSLRTTRPELDSRQIEKTVEQNRKHRFIWSCFTMFTGLALLIVFLVIQLQMIGVFSIQLALIASLSVASLIVIVAIALAIKYGQSGSRIKTTQGDKETKTIDRKDDKYWKFGMFYINKQDPSIFVEKRFGVGYTMNFGRPIGWAVLGAIVIVIIGSIIIGK